MFPSHSPLGSALAPQPHLTSEIPYLSDIAALHGPAHPALSTASAAPVGDPASASSAQLSGAFLDPTLQPPPPPSAGPTSIPTAPGVLLWYFWTDTWKAVRGHAEQAQLRILEAHPMSEGLLDALQRHRPGLLGQYSSLHVFREGIRPIYEDEVNRVGGHFKLSHSAEHNVELVWMCIVQALAEGHFPGIIHGVTVFRKQRSSYSVKLWLPDSQDKAHQAAVRQFLAELLDRSWYSAMRFCPHRFILQTLERQRGSLRQPGSSDFLAGEMGFAGVDPFGDGGAGVPPVTVFGNFSQRPNPGLEGADAETYPLPTTASPEEMLLALQLEHAARRQRQLQKGPGPESETHDDPMLGIPTSTLALAQRAARAQALLGQPSVASITLGTAKEDSGKPSGEVGGGLVVGVPTTTTAFVSQAAGKSAMDFSGPTSG
eukprot:RCo034279